MSEKEQVYELKQEHSSVLRVAYSLALHCWLCLVLLVYYYIIIPLMVELMVQLLSNILNVNYQRPSC